MVKGTRAAISCVVTGLTKKLEAVAWEKPLLGGMIANDIDGYHVDMGIYNSETKSQTTTLTIPASANTATAIFTCVIRCKEHGKTAFKMDVKSNLFSEYASNCRRKFLFFN